MLSRQVCSAMVGRAVGAQFLTHAVRPLLSRAFSAAAAPHIVDEPNPLGKLAEDEAFIADAVKNYAENEIKPKIAQMDSAGALDADVLRGLFDQGFMGVTVDSDFGGTQSSFTAQCLVVEELARQDAGVATVCELHNVLCNMTVARHGSQGQKQEYLPRMAADTLAAFVAHDPNVGADAAPITARHDAGANQYILQGKRAWCTSGQQAGLLLVKADSSLFLLEANHPGVKMSAPLEKLGLRAAQVSLVDFEDAVVPADNVIGEAGAAEKYWREAQARCAVSSSALLVGLARGVYDSTMPYLYARTQFGTAIANFQGMQHQRAQVATEIEAARLLAYNAARMVDHGRDFVPAARLALNYATRVARKSSSMSIEWLGGVGFTKDFPAEKFYRDCKLGSRFPLLSSDF